MSTEQEKLNFDPQQIMQWVTDANKYFQQIVETLVNKQQASAEEAPANIMDFNSKMSKLMENVTVNPLVLIDEQMRMMQSQMQLWQNVNRQIMGESPEAVIEPASDDKRFKDPEWTENPYFNFIKQYYLLLSRCILNITHGTESSDKILQKQVEFFTRQYVNAMSPSNFIATNPEVLRTTIETKGQNLVQGMKQFAEDLKRSGEGLNVAMTDYSAFKLGKNVATTPGEVVFQNDMMQLIHYHPQTDKQFKTPLLIVPPWINKYYILDLKESNSLVRWLTMQGHSVFIISWVNPDATYRETTWEDYMKSGSIAALDTISEITGEKQTNVISYCIGGTLMATTMAYLTAKKQADKVKSITYMATLQDFKAPGEIGVFINDQSLKQLEAQMDAAGYLDGRSLAFSFNLLRENDLFWSYFINNYLKGKTPRAFDLLYWNSDGTNLPAGMHKFYLRNMYLENKLIQPNGIELDGVGIDLRTIKTPAFFVSTIADHIAKWISTYTGATLHSGPVEFVLSGSGHIAGIVNPPADNKYGYWTNSKIAKTSDEWLEGATKHEGSWWTYWQEWAEKGKFADKSDMIEPRVPGSNKKYKSIEAAPGSYVKRTILDTLKVKRKKAAK